MEDWVAMIARERRQQVELGYTPDHDRGHTPAEWIALLTRHLGLAVDDGSGRPGERFEKQLVRVAALCVAALEATHGRTAGLPESAREWKGW